MGYKMERMNKAISDEEPNKYIKMYRPNQGSALNKKRNHDDQEERDAAESPCVDSFKSSILVKRITIQKELIHRSAPIGIGDKLIQLITRIGQNAPG